jgi:type II secretory pathway component PulM
VKKYFAQLRPLERRVILFVAVVVFAALNWALVWPHFSDWSNLSNSYRDAQQKLKLYQSAIALKPDLEKSVAKYESQGEFVAPEDQAINFMKTIQQQASQSGFGIEGYSSRTAMQTNQFFVEQYQTITVHATEAQLVDFLYQLGTKSSMVRVSDLELQPDSPRQHLAASVKLVASYRKNSKAPAPAAAVPAAKGATNSTAKAK